MKKSLLTAVSLITLAFASFADWEFTFASGAFFDNSGAMIHEEYKFALIVDMNNKGFGSDFVLKEGDSFSAGTTINTSGDYKTLKVGTLVDDSGEGYYLAYGGDDLKFNNDLWGLKGGEAIALVVWNTKNDVLAQNDMYTVLNPAYTDTTSSGHPVNWLVSATNTGSYNWELYSKATEGDTSDEFFTLSKVVQAGGVVPEPNTYAAIFGILAFGFVAYRKRK